VLPALARSEFATGGVTAFSPQPIATMHIHPANTNRDHFMREPSWTAERQNTPRAPLRSSERGV